MKNLLFIFLIFVSCVSSKQKTKDKEELNSTVDIKKSTTNSEKGNSSVVDSKKDSVSTNSNYNLARTQLFANQNFQLKNNGKCADPGVLRNVEFTDALGNKTSIPINDNTDLSFHNETELTKEIESLKLENKQLTETVTDTQAKYEKSLLQNEEFKQKINAKSSNTNTETQSVTIWQFILCGVLSIVLWEIIWKLIKNYLP